MTLDGTTPAALRQALRDRFGKFAGPGEAFNASDVEQPGVENRRLAFLWQNGPRWVAAIEVGGRGYSIAVTVFELGASGPIARLVETATAYPDTSCSIAAGLIGHAPQ